MNYPSIQVDGLKVLRTISGGPNVVEFIAAYRELDRVFVVMNFFPHDDIFKRCKRLIDGCGVLTPTPSGILKHPKCGCSSFSEVCDSCRELPVKHVNKAGTPGYRAPEVLLRFDEQTTEIDVFAAGITMLSFLMKKHPIFRPSNDIEALAQMATFLGSSSLVQAAAEGGVTLLCDPSLPGMDMVKLVNNFSRDIREAQGSTKGCRSCMVLVYQNNSGFCFCKHSEEESVSRLRGLERVAFEVLRHSLNPSPSRRYSAVMLADLIGSPVKMKDEYLE
ncbi:unnamed protein product [Angiostrongylus costaricensis]|uniref:non-specific serine/threonine protein kinase n=1 Tax=Angiostrongylus costaricensis TaxID=334426 RepID=A0A0R3PFA2_ANGCS|nr:unnamed protein product [Angiostrongylus costaricensis]